MKEKKLHIIINKGEEMRIIYLTDLHDEFKPLRTVFQQTDADLYIVSGDLIYKAFVTEDRLYHFLDVQEKLSAYSKRIETNSKPYQLASSILADKENHEAGIIEASTEYKYLFEKAATTMRRKYETLKRLINTYTSAKTIVIPGNYDMNLQYTALSEYDLHKRHFELNGIKLAGYGGAPIFTPGIPETLSVVYHENQKGQTVKSEPKDFLSKIKPHIAVIHNPAYGVLDKMATRGHSGSFGVRDYIDEHQPVLVLSGHIHEDYGLMQIADSFCLNPSNFGGVDSLMGYDPGGFFTEIVIQNKTDYGEDKKPFLKQVTLRRIIDNQITDIAGVKIDKNYRARQIIKNEEEFNKIGHFLI